MINENKKLIWMIVNQLSTKIRFKWLVWYLKINYLLRFKHFEKALFWILLNHKQYLQVRGSVNFYPIKYNFKFSKKEALTFWQYLVYNSQYEHTCYYK